MFERGVDCGQVQGHYMTITGDILKKICVELEMDHANALAEISNKLCIRYAIDTPTVYHEFIANVAHESGEFSIRKESLTYTHPNRIVAVWPTRFNLTGLNNKFNANAYVNNPKALANVVYGGRMGNVQTDDGYNFVGGGFAQITGRDAYTMFTSFINSRDNTRFTITQVAKLVQSDDQWAFDSAFWFFAIFKNLEELATQDNFRLLVKRWNGGFIGLEQRQKYYELAKQYIV
ncbi:COG3179 Predicted chitinase [uncultured Caudovirales phage]|uniref:COG3179 Predicted chitinase n=1 Tax=uncultured Caudovirales phage TaxID=2100421 RepID=A0A6J7W9M5_9CAUD|nr:COG3179 Predicted chitinase [uncultured Caudovirales phage]CAB5170194.1 COG3179 Predicted chitinase [uncultured Caudovirales phage]